MDRKRDRIKELEEQIDKLTDHNKKTNIAYADLQNAFLNISKLTDLERAVVEAAKANFDCAKSMGIRWKDWLQWSSALIGAVQALINHEANQVDCETQPGTNTC